jgi:chaperonin cofactor prefoldin
MKKAENRYETQREAAAQQTPEQKEQLEVLSRLKELAQRQQDVNEKLKGLQTALQEAKTEKGKGRTAARVEAVAGGAARDDSGHG